MRAVGHARKRASVPALRDGSVEHTDHENRVVLLSLHLPRPCHDPNGRVQPKVRVGLGLLLLWARNMRRAQAKHVLEL